MHRMSGGARTAGTTDHESPLGRPGTYALVLSAVLDATVQIGRLGPLHIRPGYYVYVGSALGPGGVRARVAHHRRPALRPHWHIDYLRLIVPPVAIWYTYDALPREHQWAEVLQCMRAASIPLRRFGASDCTCASHLYCFPTCPSWHAFRRRLRNAVHTPTPVYCQRLALLKRSE